MKEWVKPLRIVEKENIIPKAERILRNTGNFKSRIRKKSLKKDTFRKMEGKLLLNDKN